MVLSASPLLRWAVALLAFTALGCSSGESAYFTRGDPIWVRAPTLDGQDVYVGIGILIAQGSDRVHLGSVEANGVEGDASIEGLAAVLGAETHLVGIGTVDALTASGVDLDAYRPITEVSISAQSGPVALILKVTGKAWIRGFRDVTLRFEVDGGVEQIETFPTRATICSGATLDEALVRCRPIEEQMHSFGT
ncbi:MAG: hypothetical protein V4515_09005 [Chloroflexota bacterium]